jgi:hypothetical protein
MQAQFLAAWVPVSFRGLGYTLKPLNFAHLLALHLLENPFVTAAREPDPADTVAFLKICSQEQPEASLRVSWLDRFKVRMLKRNPALLSRINHLCLEYIKAHGNNPEFWENQEEKSGSSPKRISAPWVLARISYLLSNSTLTLDQIMRTRIDKLAWIEASIAELKGAEIEFVDPDELEDFRRWRAEDRGDKGAK